MIITNAQLLDRFDKRQKHFIMSSSRNGGRSSPAVVGRVVYVGGGNSIYALNATNGAKLWSYTIGGEVESSPAVANGVVYAGSDDGNIYAFGTTSQSSNTLLIAIGVVVAVVIIAAVVFLMFQKRLKTKRTSPPPTP